VIGEAYATTVIKCLDDGSLTATGRVALSLADFAGKLVGLAKSLSSRMPMPYTSSTYAGLAISLIVVGGALLERQAALGGPILLCGIVSALISIRLRRRRP